ncbi:MAG: peptidyl-tRNA hydrolase PTH1 family [Candidatus Saganbacteria bacterium]|uniref:Peptidyl-tRNA hydrolase n=1 Tax=Candidatus Saganbacteria bacterium TaxID=2575572 RepID=A0A833L208_UNCSA|nr:MAG: peptidyl-tRNA hydrolase PTH1 family [Candidatus Saganbacteria bacterium]
MYLVVGLGNPGKQYENTRHNTGFLVVEEFAKLLNVSEFKSKSKLFSLTAEADVSGHKVIIAEPQTFMNNSGQAVSALANWYKINLDHIIIAYDDVDLEIGKIRIRQNGNSGGHHGIESIILHRGLSDFNRVRVGIGRESLTGDVADYVLQKIPNEQKDLLAITKAAEAIKAIIEEGIDSAMNRFNA